jgi:DNA repair exonuclease SbcCD nuclease subunit
MMPHAWKDRPELCGDAECVLSQVVHAARERNLPVIAAGDLFDSKRPPVEIMVATGQLLCHMEGDYIMGNHDITPTPWMKLVAPHWNDLAARPVERLPRNRPAQWNPATLPVRVLDPLFDTEKPWHIYGLHYFHYVNRLAAELDLLGGEIDPNPAVARLLVLHQASEALMPVGKCELTDGMIPDCFDLVVVGDYHRPALFSLRSKSGRPIPCLSPGGLHLTSIREEPEKKLYTLHADGSLGMEPLVTRRVIEVNLCGMTESEVSDKATRVLQAVHNTTKPRPAGIARPIVIADTDTGTAPGAERIVQRILGENVHLFIRSEEERTLEIDLSLIEDIDVGEYAATGYRLAKDVFRQNEPDPEVQRIAETFLDNAASASLYHTLKEDFLNRHRSVPQSL